MADEYIRKQDAANVVANTAKIVASFNYQYAIDALLALTPADVAPVVHAYWIPQKENYEFKEAWMKCSACGYPVSKWTGNTNFCPNCGARMDAQKEEQNV